jgi:hypothetical protein
VPARQVHREKEYLLEIGAVLRSNLSICASLLCCFPGEGKDKMHSSTGRDGAHRRAGCRQRQESAGGANRRAVLFVLLFKRRGEPAVKVLSSKDEVIRELSVVLTTQGAATQYRGFAEMFGRHHRGCPTASCSPGVVALFRHVLAVLTHFEQPFLAATFR